MSKTIHVEIVSDFACPWCLVGKRRLSKAIEQRPDLNFQLSWRPFQLNPDMPREGVNRRQYYRDKFGGERLKSMQGHLHESGKQEGVAFCDDPDAMAPNTLSAHVLMFWAEADGQTDTNVLAEKLLHAHHEACENIGDHEVLVRIAGEAGMDKSDVAAKLVSGEDEDRVKEQILQSTNRGVTGVPFFIIDDRYGITGAQPAETLAAAFDRIILGSE